MASILQPAQRSAPASRFPSCEGCGLTLPLSSDPKAAKQALTCVGCGKKYNAAIATDAPPELLANILLAIGINAPPPTRQADSSPTARTTPVTRERAQVTAPPSTRASRAFDAVLDERPSLKVVAAGEPLLKAPGAVGPVPYDEEAEQKLTAEYTASTEQLDALVDAVERGGSVDVEETDAIARTTLVQATRDLDLFLKVGVETTGEGYPGRHSLHASMLAVGIGARLGWDRETLVQLGVGCLIHDLGMLKVPDKDYLREEVLDDIHFSQIAAHPLHTFDLIEEHLDKVPLATRMVAYQIHERCDGTGYPRKRRSPLIHEASRVAAVADVFVALVSPRPHRQSLLPYYAMEHLIRSAGAGKFDKDTVRALLRTVSLYPIGSYVELSDQRVGRVIRSNPDSYCDPVIELWRPDELDAPPAILDLAAEDDLKVRRPLSGLAA